MIIPVSGLYVTNFVLLGGVYTLHKMVLAPTGSLAISAKPRVFLFREGSGQWYSRSGWYLLQCDALAMP